MASYLYRVTDEADTSRVTIVSTTGDRAEAVDTISDWYPLTLWADAGADDVVANVSTMIADMVDMLCDGQCVDGPVAWLDLAVETITAADLPTDADRDTAATIGAELGREHVAEAIAGGNASPWDPSYRNDCSALEMGDGSWSGALTAALWVLDPAQRRVVDVVLTGIMFAAYRAAALAHPGITSEYRELLDCSRDYV